MICIAALRLGSVVQLAADATSDTSALAPFRSDWPGLELALLIALEWRTPFLAAHLVPRLPQGTP